MAHMLFISRYYPPETGVAGVCMSELATRLVKLGHRVTVLTTFPNYPTGIVPAEYRGRLIQHETLAGVNIVRVWCYIAPNKGFLRRILAQLSFGVTAPLLGSKEVSRPDVVIVGSPPLFNVIAGRTLAWFKRCPLIFKVDDLWPESAIQLGVLRNRMLIALSEWLEWSTYRKAGLVLAVTEGIYHALVRRGLAPERVFLLTNGVDTVKFRPLPQAQARVKVGWDRRFTVLYAGNHGLVYALPTVLDAAELMGDDAGVHFILVGDGVRKAELVADAKRRGLKNVTFQDSVPHERVPWLLAAADVCLIPLRKLPLLEGSLPVKMFEVMACARPFVLGAEGEVRRLAEQEVGAAVYVEPENATALVSAILSLRDHPELAGELGRRGRALVEARFDYDRLTAALDERIALLLGKKTPLSGASPPSPVGAAVGEGEACAVETITRQDTTLTVEAPLVYTPNVKIEGME